MNNVSEHDVRALIRTVVSRGAHRQAISFFADLPQMFSWTRKRQPWQALLVEGAPTELVDISPLIPARKALSRRYAGAADGQNGDWTPHDLRHTGAIHDSGLGGQPRRH